MFGSDEDSLKVEKVLPSPSLDVPHMDALCGNVEQGITVRVVGDERHDGVVLLDHWGVRQLFKVIRPGETVTGGRMKIEIAPT